MIKNTIRLLLTLFLLIMMWFDYKWALYTIITLLSFSNEIVGYAIEKLFKN